MNAPTDHAHLAPQLQLREVPAALIEALQQRFGAQCSTALVVREQHGRDESIFNVPPPSAVVFAQSTQDVADTVKLAAQYKAPVIPFGVGSSLEGHLLAVQGGISIDVSRMDKVLSINAEDLTVTVQPGITRMGVNNAVKSEGLFFPIDPGADASIGGMTATRASGTNAVRYGTMRENVLALEVVTAKGEVIRTGTRAKKAVRRLRPHAPDGGQRRHAGRDHRGHAQALPAARGHLGRDLLLSHHRGRGAHRDPGDPAGCADRALRADRRQHRAHGERAQQARPARRTHAADGVPRLACQREGAGRDGAGDRQRVRAATPSNGRPRPKSARACGPRGTTRISPPSRASRAAAPSAPTPACRSAKLADCLLDSVAEADASGIPYFLVGHVGDGNFHFGYLIDPAKPEEHQKAEALNHTLVARALALEGTCTGEHGVGLHKMDFLRTEAGDGAVDMMRAVKRALDPDNILNPGKIFSL